MTENKNSTEEPAESRLSRWSRRKLEQQATDLSENANEQESLEENAALEPIDATPEAPVLTDEDMPPVESLNSDSDFSGFLSPGVSDELRKLALRKLFALPNFQLRDGLDDYDDDFTVFEPLGDIVTNDPWTHRQKRLAAEKEAAEKEAAELEQQAVLQESAKKENGPTDGPEPDQEAESVDTMSATEAVVLESDIPQPPSAEDLKND